MGRGADALFTALMGACAGSAAQMGRFSLSPLWQGHMFDAHVFACALSLAAEEAGADGGDLASHLGLQPDEVEAIVARYFTPPALAWLGVPLGRSEVDEEEALVADLLRAHCAPGDAGGWLASLIARRAMRPNHLWQDLGLRDRAELSRLLTRHFPALAAGNSANMKWKKYFYRRLCEAEGFSLCSAPSCAQCSDFEACFGDESGESRLARRRRSEDLFSA